MFLGGNPFFFWLVTAIITIIVGAAYVALAIPWMYGMSKEAKESGNPKLVILVISIALAVGIFIVGAILVTAYLNRPVPIESLELPSPTLE